MPVPDAGAGCRMPDGRIAGCRAGAGCRMPDAGAGAGAGCRLPDAGCRVPVPDAGCRMPGRLPENKKCILWKWMVPLLTDLRSQGLLHRAREGASDLNAALSFLYNAPLWLEHEECKFVYNRGMNFLQAYSALARDCFRQNKYHLYPLYPKLHAVHHVWLLISQDGDSVGYAMNPLPASCQQDEDIVGKVSRTSRRVNVRMVIQRTLQRYLMASYKVWFDAKIIA